MRKGEAFPSKWLSKEDLFAGPLRATIATVGFEEVKSESGTEDKTIITFKEQGIKPLIVNITNWDRIEAAYSEESNEWIGKTIELYHDPDVMFGRVKKGGVRVRIPNGAPAPAAAPAAAPTAAPEPVEQMLWEDAKSAALEAGLDEDELKARLKQRSVATMTKSEAGPTVPAWVVNAIIEEQNSAIPFSRSPSA